MTWLLIRVRYKVLLSLMLLLEETILLTIPRTIGLRYDVIKVRGKRQIWGNQYANILVFSGTCDGAAVDGVEESGNREPNFICTHFRMLKVIFHCCDHPVSESRSFWNDRQSALHSIVSHQQTRRD